MSTIPLPPVPPSPTASTFAYDAQTDEGQRVVGTIEAADTEHATVRLRAMQLRVIEVRPTTPRPDGKRLRGGDLITFNQQLAQLTAAGMPIEQGLRMIAADLGRGKLKRTVDRMATELEGGTAIDQAFEKYQNQFPPLYGRVIRAGVKGGNLPAVLLSLGKHLDLTQRLRATLWRAVSYPLVVLVTFGFLLSFLGMVVLPEFEKIYADLHLELPLLTRMLFGFSAIAPALLFTLIALVILAPIAWGMLHAAGYGNLIVERLVVQLPLIGPVLRANLVARWCDGAKLGVQAGLDLPHAIALGNDASGSERLARDGAALAEALGAGRSLTSATTSLLPATVPAAIQFASGYSDLGSTLDSLSEMYRRQAETRIEAIPGVLTPLLVLLIAFMIVFVVVALFAPFASLLKLLQQGW